MPVTLTLRRGDTFRFEATYKADDTPVDLTGYTAEMVISWPAYKSSVAPAVQAGEVACTMAALDSSGAIVGTLTIAQTALIPTSGPLYDGPTVLFQLRIRVSDNPVTTLLSGTVNVSPNVFDLVT